MSAEKSPDKRNDKAGLQYFIQLDADGSLLFADPNSKLLLGLPERLTRKSQLINYLDKADRKRFDKKLRLISPAMPQFEFTTTIIAKQGERIAVLLHGLGAFTKKGNLQKIPLTITRVDHDSLTSAVQAKSNLAEENSRLPGKSKKVTGSQGPDALFRSVVDNMGDGVIVVDTRGKITYVNTPAALIFGERDWKMIGRDVTEYLVEERNSLTSSRSQLTYRNLARVYRTTIVGRGGSKSQILVSSKIQSDKSGEPLYRFLILSNLVEKRKILSALHITERKLDLITSNMIDMVSFMDREGRIEYASPSFKDVLGYEVDDLLKKSYFDYIHPDDREAARDVLLKPGKKERRARTEYRIRNAAGEYLWLETLVHFKEFNEERIDSFIVAGHRDITTRKEAEDKLRKARDGLELEVKKRTRALAKTNEALKNELNMRIKVEQELRKSEENYRTIFNSVENGISIHDLKTGKGIDVNEAWLNMFECEREELGNISLADISPAEEGYRDEGIIARIKEIEEKGFVRFEFHGQKRKSGKDFWLEVTCIITELANRKCMMAISRDITEAKAIKEALEKSEANYRTIFDSVGEGIAVHDTDSGKIIAVNNAWLKLFGCSREDVEKLTIDDLSSQEREFTGADGLQKIRDAALIGPQHFDWYGKKASTGELFWSEVHLESAMLGGEKRVLAICRDITGARQDREDLRKSEDNYRTIFNSVSEGISVHDIETGKYLDVNKAWLELFECDPEEVTLLEVGDISADEPGFRSEDALAVIQKAAQEGPQVFEWHHIKRRSGLPFWAEVSCIKANLGGRDVVLGIQRDITEFKKAQAALKESENRYRSLFDKSNDFVFIHDKDNRILEMNPAAERAFSFMPGEKRTLDDSKFLTLEQYEASKLLREEIWRNGASKQPVELCIVNRSGKHIHMEVTGTTLVENGKPYSILSIGRDITARKIAERALRESEEKSRFIIENMNEGLAVVDTQGRLNFVNAASCRIFGYPPEELAGKKIFDLVAEESRSVLEAEFGKRRYGVSDSYEIIWQKKNGVKVPTIVSPQPIYDESGGFSGSFAIITDLSEVKKVEDELRESEDKYRTIFNAVSDGISIRDARTHEIIGANDAWNRMFKADLEGLPRIIETGTETNNSRLDSLIDYVEESSAGMRICHYQRKSGGDFWCELNLIETDLGGRECVIGVVRDITNRVKANERLLHYQQQLLNLASELSLAEERERRKIANAIHDNIGQMLTVAKIKLSTLKAKKHTTEERSLLVDVVDYIGQAINFARNLTFEISSPVLYDLGFIPAIEWLVNNNSKRYEINIKLEKNIDQVELPEDLRVTLFQSVRELLHNVYKHSRATAAQVIIDQSEDWLEITIRDNGVGFAEVQDEDKPEDEIGFGMFSIRERLKYYGGDCKIVRGSNTLGGEVILIAPIKITAE